MTEILEVLATLSLLVFVIGSMASTGLSLKMKQIVAPLKDVKLVILALAVNFVLVPIVAYVITLVLPLDESLKIGLLLLATAAGSPVLAGARSARTALHAAGQEGVTHSQ